MKSHDSDLNRNANIHYDDTQKQGCFEEVRQFIADFETEQICKFNIVQSSKDFSKQSKYNIFTTKLNASILNY